MFVRLQDKRISEFATYQEACEIKRFKRLGTDADRIAADAKHQVRKILYQTYSHRKRYGNQYTPDLSAEDMRKYIMRGIVLHLETLKNKPETVKDICEYIETEVRSSPINKENKIKAEEEYE